MKPGRPDSVFVNRLNWGEKYLFASVSIPDDWIEQGKVEHPADLAKLLGQWREAFERERAGR